LVCDGNGAVLNGSDEGMDNGGRDGGSDVIGGLKKVGALGKKWDLFSEEIFVHLKANAREDEIYRSHYATFSGGYDENVLASGTQVKQMKTAVVMGAVVLGAAGGQEHTGEADENSGGDARGCI
jgi:hypothetical protein